ncbi:MAG: Smr/MutS family protein [Verrucomicrobiae bacterium]|nr:Smr/MutS family protein [Verrucomicrobiae bacterium]
MEPVEYPIDGELDLHTFRPQEIKDLIPDYLELCQERGILKVRVVHGKGTGTLRTTVHALLSKISMVKEYHLADERSGGWGATWVYLHPRM